MLDIEGRVVAGETNRRNGVRASILVAALALLSMVPASSSKAQPAIPEAQRLFPDAGSGFAADGRQVTLRPDGTVPVTLRSYRFEPIPGRAETLNAFWCGLVLDSGNGASQAIVTIGSGFSETLSCDRLVESAAMPPAGNVPRLGLIYATRSPNASGRTPLVLRWDEANRRWAIDEPLSTELDDRLDPRTLARMRAMLLQRR
jgi:hypothetical protein